jgi:hypothetical protein
MAAVVLAKGAFCSAQYRRGSVILNTKASTAIIRATSSAGTAREFSTIISMGYPPLGIPAAPIHDSVQVILRTETLH